MSLSRQACNPGNATCTCSWFTVLNICRTHPQYLAEGCKKSAKISYFSLCDVIDPAASPFSPLITQQSPVGPHTVDISLSLPSFGTEIYSTLWFCSSTHRFLLFSFLFCFVDTLLCLGSLSCCLNKFLPNFSCQTDGFIFASEYFGIQRSLWSTQCLQGTQTTVLDSW